jgi:type IV secretory pathway VirB4 component
MVRVSRILKDHREAGSVNALLALWGFVDEHAFLTKAGALGVVFRVEGADYECLDHSERRVIAHRFERALRQLDESFRVYQYLIKRPTQPLVSSGHANPVVDAALKARAVYFTAKADSLFELELYIVVLFEAWAHRPSPLARISQFVRSPRTALRETGSVDGMARVMEHGVGRALAFLRQKADAFATQLADAIHPTLLAKGDAFRMLRQLVNCAPHKIDAARLKYDTHLDFYVADSAVDCHRAHLDIDGYRTKVLTMKEPPARTFAHMLQDLYSVPSTFVACLEWQRLSNASMRRNLHARRRHFFNKRVSMINYLSPQTRPEEMLVE